MDYVSVAMLGVAIGFIGGLAILEGEAQRVIIEHGYGLYCPVSGNFAFNGECK